MKPITIDRVRQFPLWRPLSVRDFRLLWVAQGVSLFGDQFYLVALPWLALQLTGSALALGTVLMVAAGARAAFQLLGGALSDRFTPRTLMLVSNIVRAAVSASITAVVVTGVVKLWHLYLFSIVFGVVDAFFFPASVSVVPMLIVKEHLTAGNALLRGTNRLMTLVGPALAGVIIVQQSLGMAFAIDAATFIFAALMLSLMKEQKRYAAEDGTPASEEPSGFTGLLASIKDGLRYAWRHPLIRALLLFIAFIEFSFTGPAAVGLPAIAKNRFGAEGGPIALGWMLSALGGGMLLGMLVAGSMNLAQRRGRLVIGTSLVIGIGLAMIGFATHVVWAALILAFVGLAAGLANLTIVALLQSEADKRMLGRVMGVLMFASSVLEPLSLALAGLMADLDLKALFVAGGAFMLIATLLSLKSRTLREFD